MPLYKLPAEIHSVASNNEVETVVNNERLSQLAGFGTPPQYNFSQRVAISDKSGGGRKPVILNFSYATVPASVQYDIYVSMEDDPPLIGYTKVGSTTNVNGDQVTLQREAAGGNMFRFVCVREVGDPGVLATVDVSQ
jgi:hypothetical protein